MRKIKYQFDSKTLTFKKVTLSWKQRVKRTFLFVFTTVSAAVAIHFLYTLQFKTPKEILLLEEREHLLTSYDILNEQMNQIEWFIGDIQHRDDYVYRTIYEADPIPNAIREAGFGGTNRYIDLEGYENSDVLINTSMRLDMITKKLYVQSKSFDAVIDLVKNKEKMLAAIPAIQPLAIKDFDRISDYFGSRKDPFNGKLTMHHGMDFTGPEGADIYATGDGVVVESGYSFYGYGNRVVIDHGYGFKTVYAHLKDIHAVVGQKVKRGEVIGTLGNTGRSTGPHLHYEVRKHDITVNPINYYFNNLTEQEYEEMVLACSKNRTPMD